MNDPIAMMMMITGAFILAVVGFILIYAFFRE